MPQSRKVLIVHGNGKFSQRMRKEFRKLEGLDVEFMDAAVGLGQRPAGQEPDVIVVDLAVLPPRGFTIHRIFEARSPLMPPVAIFRAARHERAKERRQVCEGLQALENSLHVALGRTPHEFSWLPVRFAGVHLIADLPNTEVVVDGRTISISARESEVLGLLLTHCNRLVRRELLISEIWGYETRSLDVHIRRLRQKLGSAGRQLETVAGFGYRFTEANGSTRIRSDGRFYEDETGPFPDGCTG